MKGDVAVKKLIYIALISAVSLMSLNAQSEVLAQEKRFAIGIGTYALQLSYDNSNINEDDKFSGAAISLAYSFTDNVAVKGALYKMEHDDVSELEASGYDLVIVGGAGLATQGFKIYGGGGLFSETWEVSGLSGDEDFSGTQLVGGLGYNWDVIAVDLSVSIRDADDYVDLLSRLGGTGDVIAVSGGLTVSVRF